MIPSFDIWRMLAGIAIFIAGMQLMEDALRQLAGRPFKLFLKKQTSNNTRAVTGGAIVTAVLQSSSVVNLMVLSFVGAGVIKMQNALALMLGANLGTTLSNWLVATIGFSLNIESFALPITGIAGLLMLLTGKDNPWHTWGRLLLGFGFLFIGLNYMKTGIGEMVERIDLSVFTQYPAIVFFALGFLITSVVQSSTVTVALVLSALHANAITLYTGSAIVLGAEIGTSLKLVLASLGGSAVKKRVAWGNVLFNVLPALLVLMLLQPVNRFITGVIGIGDNLLALVFFQTLVNVTGILVFLPFLSLFGRFLERRFRNDENDTLFIHKIPVTETGPAMEALEKETQSFIGYVSAFAMAAFNRPLPPVNHGLVNKSFSEKTLMAKYDFIKHLHGVINEYSIQLRNMLPEAAATARIERMLTAIRHGMYAAKSMKDACSDIRQLRNSSNNVKYTFYRDAGDTTDSYYHRLLPLLFAETTQPPVDTFNHLYTAICHDYRKNLGHIYTETGAKHLTEIEFSTLINFNRQVYESFNALLLAVRDYLPGNAEKGPIDEYHFVE